MSAPLTNRQKGYLAQLAQRAADKLGAVHPDSDEGRARELERFRHVEVAKACGKMGLRCCSQDDYGAVKGHFLHLLGEDDKALSAMVNGDAEANQRRTAEMKIVAKCQEMGKRIAYADGICRRMTRGKGLQEVTAKTLWKVFFALKYANGEARRGARSEAREEVFGYN
jgi:hypothetical protein